MRYIPKSQMWRYNPVVKELRREWLEHFPWCAKCGSTRRLQVDHVVPVSQGGSWGNRNMQTLCKSCHQRKTRRDNMSARRRNAEDHDQRLLAEYKKEKPDEQDC